ncbi:MAG: helix-turn-helix domain-containing protein [Gemmatimonadales bacterium]
MVDQFGERVRARRVATHLTLQALADASGVSVSMLSQVERGQRAPTLPLAVRIADGLGCPLSDLLDADPETAETSGVIRREQDSGAVDPETGVRRVLLSRRLPPATAEVAWYRIPPGQTAGPFLHRDADLLEQVTVTAGRLDVRLGRDTLSLRAGDTLAFAGTTEHAFTNGGRTECSVIHVAHPRRGG